MKKLSILILTFFCLTGVAQARTCALYAIAESLKFQGQPANYKVMDIELGQKDGYYIDKTLKKLKIDFKKVRKIKTFPVIVEYAGHAFAVTGSLGQYWRVKDTLCKNCLYSKKTVKRKAIAYYLIK